MGGVRIPRQMFLCSMAGIYLFAFASLYIQIPGLYGEDGVKPVHLPRVETPLLEKLQDVPSLLWLAPSLGIGPQQGLELICLLGALLSLGAVLLSGLRDSLVYLCLWALYLSLYTVGGDFLHSEWDSLLLEAGFLAFLVAPCGLLRSFSAPHDTVTFWLTRWLLFRLVLCTGVSKLASGDPCWWDLTALSRHYDTQASPTPLAWYAHQLPDWLSRLGAVCVLAVEIAVPLLMFFIPVRGLRINAFSILVVLQLCNILLGGCSLFNLLTIALAFSLLDDEVFDCSPVSKKKAKTKTWGQFLVSSLTFLFKLSVHLLVIFSAVKFFKLEIHWEKKIVTSKPTFSRESFNDFVSQIQVPSIWIGVLSLTWEVVAALLKCLYVRGILGKLWALLQWATFTAATVGVFTLSLVPYTALAGMSSSKILPEVREAYEAVEKFHLVSSYGIQHRMIPPAGRPEIVIEGSMDKKTWTELSFMYKPGSMSGFPAVLGPHEPRLDWLLWEAARAKHDQSPWFAGLIQRLLEGKQDVLSLLQVDEAQYPFSSKPPAFIRAKVYHYHFTHAPEDGTEALAWWKRQYVTEFFPTVHLGDPALDELLSEAGLKEEFLVQPVSDTPLSQALSVVQGQAKGLSGHVLTSSLFASVASILLIKALFSRTRSTKSTKPRPAASEQKSKKSRDHTEPSEKSRSASSRGGKKENSEERKLDSDKSPRKRK
ncbi:lipase maturation factor 2b [Pangasianodon hypophthalmus]|uniref:lipase maturation factor 2b n=1 Tax=Pangasianodon hypophthalmus TaxID=310915 RepID=UPI002307F8D3|nr:lipase maturation factor 2b [Pangasianodon hypophthalmus]